QDRPIAIYVTSDKQHALVGTLIDAEGNDLSSEQVGNPDDKPGLDEVWSDLEETDWVADGADDAPRTVYMFTDPNCPYCHQFWELARPWVEAGKVQVRHILVGILKPDSMPKAAAILSAKDPAARLEEAEKHYDDGGIEAMDNPSAG